MATVTQLRVVQVGTTVMASFPVMLAVVPVVPQVIVMAMLVMLVVSPLTVEAMPAIFPLVQAQVVMTAAAV